MIYGIEPGEFEEAAIRARYPLEEFRITQTDVPPSLNLPGSEVSGWVTIRRHTTGNARTYEARAGRNWLMSFKRDLESGVFGKPGKSPLRKA